VKIFPKVYKCGGKTKKKKKKNEEKPVIFVQNQFLTKSIFYLAVIQKPKIVDI
jgi:hypothetical protein